MNANPNDPKKQPETEWHGELQEFAGQVLSPDDPSLEPRERRGEPTDRQRPPTNTDTDGETTRHPTP